MHWQELDLPLNASSWSEEDLKKPEKFYEMTVLLNAQREIADKILDAQWETKWRQEKVGKAASFPANNLFHVSNHHLHMHACRCTSTQSKKLLSCQSLDNMPSVIILGRKSRGKPIRIEHKNKKSNEKGFPVPYL